MVDWWKSSSQNNHLRYLAIDFLRLLLCSNNMNEPRTGGYLASNQHNTAQPGPLYLLVPVAACLHKKYLLRWFGRQPRRRQPRWQLHGQMHKVEYSRSLSVQHLISFPVVFGRAGKMQKMFTEHRGQPQQWRRRDMDRPLKLISSYSGGEKGIQLNVSPLPPT